MSFLPAPAIQRRAFNIWMLRAQGSGPGAVPFRLTFDDYTLTDPMIPEGLGNFYAGGGGPNYGVQPAATADPEEWVIGRAIWDGGTFDGPNPYPSGSQCVAPLFPDGTSAFELDIAAGFDTAFSMRYIILSGFSLQLHFYREIADAVAFDSSAILPSTGAAAFATYALTFTGTCKKIRFTPGGSAGQVLIDNMTFGSANPDGPL